MTILYVGSLNASSNSFRRFKTFELLGYSAMGIDVEKFIYGNLFEKIHYHLNMGPGIISLNKAILKAISELKPDILFVDNKSYLTPGTLRIIRKMQPQIKVVNLITDDFSGKSKRTWRLSLKTAKYFDIHFVQREPNVNELISFGANRVELCYRSYDPLFHRPIEFTTEERIKYHAGVGFIGTHENEREAYIAFLIEQGIPVKVIGDGWPKGKYWSLISPYYQGASCYGEEYVKNINGMDIALHFLRKANRDEQDSRTFEIPACGVFMLAERSHLHEIFFKENEEAVFFDSKFDLLEKVKYYLAHVDERKAIAYNGMMRCKKDHYDHRGRLIDVFSKISEVKKS